MTQRGIVLCFNTRQRALDLVCCHCREHAAEGRELRGWSRRRQQFSFGGNSGTESPCCPRFAADFLGKKLGTTWKSALAEKLARAGVTNVFNLEGSLFAWANEGRPVHRGATHLVPVEVHPYDRKWGALLRAELHPRGPR